MSRAFPVRVGGLRCGSDLSDLGDLTGLTLHRQGIRSSSRRWARRNCNKAAKCDKYYDGDECKIKELAFHFASRADSGDEYGRIEFLFVCHATAMLLHEPCCCSWGVHWPPPTSMPSPEIRSLKCVLVFRVAEPASFRAAPAECPNDHLSGKSLLYSLRALLISGITKGSP